MLEQFKTQNTQTGNTRLADYLHIELSELNLLNWDVIAEKSNMGVITNYAIKFSDDSNKTILDKIIGLSDENEVDIETNFFK